MMISTPVKIGVKQSESTIYSDDLDITSIGNKYITDEEEKTSAFTIVIDMENGKKDM